VVWLSPVFEKHRGKGLVTTPGIPLSTWVAAFIALAVAAFVMGALILADFTSRQCDPCPPESTPPVESQ
jgi:hypothetical protein